MNKPKTEIVWDIEVFPNCFILGLMNPSTKKKKLITVFTDGTNTIDERNELKGFYNKAVREEITMIGFNSLDYDYPVFHYIFTSNIFNLDVRSFCYSIYQKSCSIIELERSAVPQWKVKIHQIDLFRIHHFNSPAKMTSLKAVEIALNMYNVEDLPLSAHESVEYSLIDELKTYNELDLDATDKLLTVTRGESNHPLYTGDMIKQRIEFGKLYDINIDNASEPSIAKKLFVKFISENIGLSINEVYKLRTIRHRLPIKDIIFPSVNFKSKEFSNLLEYFKSVTLTSKDMEAKKDKDKKSKLTRSVIYRNFKFDFGKGGIHGVRKNSIVNKEKGILLMSADVTSYYPMLSILNNVFPRHLGNTFIEIYQWLFNKRKEFAKGTTENAMYKIALNSSYGLSNDKNSPLYDSKFTFTITINGQLLLVQLVEELLLAIPKAKMIMLNTDGFEMEIPEEAKELYFAICSKWMKTTKLNLEYDEYETMWIRDVNNYVGLSKDKKEVTEIVRNDYFNKYTIEDGEIFKQKVKTKGAFEIWKYIYKDNSMPIVRKAMFKYLIYGIPFEKGIISDDIFDYTKRYKGTKAFQVEYHYLENGEKIIEKVGKNARYYIGNKGSNLLKIKKETGKVAFIEANANANPVLFNKVVHKPMSEYDINYKYYLSEVNKLYLTINNGQLSLF